MKKLRVPQLPSIVYEDLLRSALREDLARAGDLTSDAVIDSGQQAEAAVVFRGGGRVCGVEMALRVFDWLDGTVLCADRLYEGADVDAGARVALLTGSARTLLTGERTFLNLVGRLSGIASATRDLVALMDGTGARLAETRKTTPGLRALEKYATRVGGARNHRYGLDDAVMIKDNHVALAGSLSEAVGRAREFVGHMVKIEVEVDTLEQLEEALGTQCDVVLLDNMAVDQLREAVQMAEGSVVLEASGGVNPQTLGAIAATGVDVVSMGWLTHSAPALDVAFEMVPLEKDEKV